jgi:hypothetical protein
VRENMGMPREGRTPVFAFSSAIAVINGVVGGAAVALALGALADASLGLAAVPGGVVAIVSVVVWLRVSDTLFMARAAEVRPLFSSRG